MKKSLLFLLAPLSLALFGCSSSEDSLSSSEIPVSSSKIEQEVANINLAYSDMENALSNFFSEKSHGFRLSDLKEDVPSFLLSLKSKNTFDEIGKESKESDEIKSNLAALITEGNELTEHKETIEHKSNVKPVKVERSTDEIINSIKQFKSEIQSTKPKIPKPHTRSGAFMGKEMSASSYNTSSNESYYTGRKTKRNCC